MSVETENRDMMNTRVASGDDKQEEEDTDVIATINQLEHLSKGLDCATKVSGHHMCM